MSHIDGQLAYGDQTLEDAETKGAEGSTYPNFEACYDTYAKQVDQKLRLLQSHGLELSKTKGVSR
jgi:hypothetical protein